MAKRGSRWAYVVDVGRDPATGKRWQRTKGGFGSKGEAEAALGVALGEVRAGAGSASSAGAP